jgi:hypothetical protein
MEGEEETRMPKFIPHVAVLHSGVLAENHVYNLTFDACESPSGVYFVRLSAEGSVSPQRVTLLK